MKWRLIGLGVLLVILAAIFVAGSIRNDRLAVELPSDEPVSSVAELATLSSIEPASKIAPIATISKETMEVDRSEIDTKLKELGYHTSDTLHRISLSADVDSEASSTNN